MKSILRRLLDLNGRSVSRTLPREIHLPALEEYWSVHYRETPSGNVRARSNGRGVLTLSGRVGDSRQVARAMRRWLSRHARNSLAPWLDELSKEAGLPYGGVSVRGQRTRWASCSSRKNISLNYRLLFLPPDTVRYILNHELCHTVHLNHSRDFWEMLGSLEPGYRQLNRQAKKGMEMVPDWAKGG